MKFAHLVTFLPLVQAFPLAKRDSTELTIQNRLGNYYEVEGVVGDYFTNLSFVINSAQDDSWVWSDQFNTNLSNTFLSSTEEFCFQDFVTDMTVSGVYGSDKVFLESLGVDSLKFGVATTNQVGYSASLGLGSSSSFIEALYNAGQISSKIVSIWLQNNRSPGKIKFGGTDSSLYSGSLTYVDLIEYQTDKTNGGYFISLDTIETSSGSKLASGQTGYIDTASVLSYVPSEVLQQITDDLGASVDQASGLWTVDCGTIETTDLSYNFVFGTTDIKVQANQLFFQESDTCYLTVTETQIDSVVVLGQSFLTSIYLVFDLDKRQVGLAQVDVDRNVVTSCSLCSHSTTISSSSSTTTSTSSSTSSSSSPSSSSSFRTSSSSTFSTTSESTSLTSSSVVPRTSSPVSTSSTSATTSTSSTPSSTFRSSSQSTSTTPLSTPISTSSSSMVSTSSLSFSSSTQPCSGSLVTTTYSTTISSSDWSTVSVVTNYVCSFAVSSFQTTTETTCTICTIPPSSPEVVIVSSHQSSATPQSTLTSITDRSTSSTQTLPTSSTAPPQVTTASSSSTPESQSSTLASTWITTSTPETPSTYETTVHTGDTVTETQSCSTESVPESTTVSTSSQTPSPSTFTSQKETSVTPATQSTQTITEDCSCSTSAYVSSGNTIFTVVSTYTSAHSALVTPSTSSSLQSVSQSHAPSLSSLADYSFASSPSTTPAHTVLTFVGGGVRNQVSLAAILPVLLYIL
ncbi:hypothetical protein KL905_002480 [Ogataea polymorpha]|uniref:Peptidase A1 domain-containing protein n=1 Tax=Ogataea polymorpha TaxID=460523 RepID=A0A9P8NVP1_9ASCO|nr:hypothetical protein KL906_001736 [Ogataea polymorpha]KAG7917531.1 hypothetical protein KL927_002274 [Ogataea polymorpha]KAG7921715.1 hypothetical protein KL905_002480 [Ogataea polymorpha]KAH3660718.1 hypothetical protein OGATHE_005050 [Ogataea polymorpha]